MPGVVVRWLNPLRDRLRNLHGCIVISCRGGVDHDALVHLIYRVGIHVAKSARGEWSDKAA